MTAAEDVKTLRDAARQIRAAGPTPAEVAVADWLDAEAATRGEMEPFAELINAVISRKGGPESYITFGRRADGEVAMVTDTLNAALAVARAYLQATGGAV